jgi:Escherichia/Staphylococcus phage prohead protease
MALDDAALAEIERLYREGEFTLVEIGRRFDRSAAGISKLARSRGWPMRWEVMGRAPRVSGLSTPKARAKLANRLCNAITKKLEQMEKGMKSGGGSLRLRASSPRHEIKFLSLDLKSVETDGSFEGYASVFHREDLSRDVVMPGAFEHSLRERGATGIKMLFQHDANQPIGVWSTLAEDARGLYASGRLMPEVAKAREVHALMRAGALDGLSIGFRTVKGRRDRATGVRRLEKIDLWEISVVTFPLLPEARVATMKARPFAGAAPTERDFERWLTRDAGLTRREARALMGAGFSSLKALRDAGRGSCEESQLAAQMRAAARFLTTNR